MIERRRGRRAGGRGLVADSGLFEYLPAMRRPLVLRLLLAMLAFAGFAGDTAAKVVHGVVHLGEQRETLRVRAVRPAAGLTAGIATHATVEASDTFADHIELHVVSVAARYEAPGAIPSHDVGASYRGALAAHGALPRTVIAEARPPDADGPPPPPRAPPIG